jgi:hypothetical protein
MREKQPAGATGPHLAGREEPAVPAAVLTAPTHQLRQLAPGQRRRQGAQTGALGARHEKARLLSNKTHYSPTDPDARISVKPGKARQSPGPEPPLQFGPGYGEGRYQPRAGRFCRPRRQLAFAPAARRPAAAAARQRIAAARAAGRCRLRQRPKLCPARSRAHHGLDSGLWPVQARNRGLYVRPRHRCLYLPRRPSAAFSEVRHESGRGLAQNLLGYLPHVPAVPAQVHVCPRAKRKQINRTIYDAAYRLAWQRQQSRRGNANAASARAPSNPCLAT